MRGTFLRIAWKLHATRCKVLRKGMKGLKSQALDYKCILVIQYSRDKIIVRDWLFMLHSYNAKYERYW